MDAILCKLCKGHHYIHAFISIIILSVRFYDKPCRLVCTYDGMYRTERTLNGVYYSILYSFILRRRLGTIKNLPYRRKNVFKKLMTMVKLFSFSFPLILRVLISPSDHFSRFQVTWKLWTYTIFYNMVEIEFFI